MITLGISECNILPGRTRGGACKEDVVEEEDSEEEDAIDMDVDSDEYRDYLFANLMPTIMGLDPSNLVAESDEGVLVTRPMGSDLNRVKAAMRGWTEGRLTNDQLKNELSHFCTTKEEDDLDFLFPNEEDLKNEEEEVAFNEELLQEAEKICPDLLIKELRKGLRNIKLCSKEGCMSIARGKEGVCVRHGAKVKQCSKEGCMSMARGNGGVCFRHGAKVKQCSQEGCMSIARGKEGVCIKHGAKVKQCSSEGCTNQAKQGGVCIKHGAKVKQKQCSQEGCMSIARGKEGVCVRHGAKVKQKQCSKEGCTNQAKQGGVCIKHGAKVKQKQCSKEGMSQARGKEGVRKRQGGKRNAEGCVNEASRKKRKEDVARYADFDKDDEPASESDKTWEDSDTNTIHRRAVDSNLV